MKTNFKLITAGLILAFATSSVQAKEASTAVKIFEKKCAMCHMTSKPKNKLEKSMMVAPPIAVATRSVIIGVDAIEGPVSDKELRELSIEFLTDYLYEPTRDKGYCEDMSYKKFGAMPSLKGFISKEELDIVVPWVIDNYTPEKDKNGKYKVSSKRK